MQLTNTPEKDSESRERKKVRKINSKKRKRRRSSTSTSCSSRPSSCRSKSEEKRKSKKKRKRRKKTLPTQGEESDKSGKIENQQPSKRFTILNQDDQFKWALPEGMAKDANSHFNQYVQ